MSEVKQLSEEEKERIRIAMRDFLDPTTEAGQRYAKAWAEAREKLRPMDEAIERSTRLTAADFAIVINAKG